MYCSLKIIAALLIFSFLLPNQIILAASDSSTVTQEVFEDAVPPTLPSYPRPPSSIVPIIYNLSVSEIGPDRATISWGTKTGALCQLYFGETKEYEKGSVSENDFALGHSIKTTNLFSSTVYYFKIYCISRPGAKSQATDETFTTLAPPDIPLPLNVTELEAFPNDEKIELKWKNPIDPDFDGVRILRREDFYPSDPWDGEEIYEGSGESFTDTGLENGKRYYYTIFSYNKSGDFSSGIIISAVPIESPDIIPLPPPEIPVIYPVHPDLEKITIDDFHFYQKGKRKDLNDLEANEPLLITVDYNKFPEILKTIMVTLTKEDGRYFSFLLRINEQKTAYTAAVLAPEPARYSMSIIILDYKNQALRKIELFLEILEKEKEAIEKKMPFLFQIFSDRRFISFFLVLLLIIVLWLMKKRKAKSLQNF